MTVAAMAAAKAAEKAAIAEKEAFDYAQAKRNEIKEIRNYK